MKSEWETYFKVKVFIALTILFMSPINLAAQDNSLWNSIDSINIDCANSYFSNKAQCYQKADYRIFVAEVASTVNEVLLIRYLLDTESDKKLKKYCK